MANNLSVAEIPSLGMPRVEVVLAEVDPAVTSVTVTRTARGRSFPVRGALRRPVTGALSVVDFECPFNVQVEYRAELFAADGSSLGFTEPALLGEVWAGPPPEEWLLPGDDLLPDEFLVGTGLLSEYSWMHNPLNPDGGVRVRLARSAVPSISRPVPGAVVYPRGRRVGVMVTQPRRGVQGVTLDVICESLNEADKVQALIGDYTSNLPPVICVRLGGPEGRIRLPQPLFVGVLDITDEDVDIHMGGEYTLQRMTGDEVAPPAPGVFVPLLSRADINAYYTSRAAANADNATRVDLNRRYDLAGFAG